MSWFIITCLVCSRFWPQTRIKWRFRYKKISSNKRVKYAIWVNYGDHFSLHDKKLRFYRTLLLDGNIWFVSDHSWRKKSLMSNRKVLEQIFFSGFEFRFWFYLWKTIKLAFWFRFHLTFYTHGYYGIHFRNTWHQHPILLFHSCFHFIESL